MNELIVNWESILTCMKIDMSMSDISFKTWILPLHIKGIDQETLFLTVEHKLARDYIEVKYAHGLEKAIYTVLGKKYNVAIEYKSGEK